MERAEAIRMLAAFEKAIDEAWTLARDIEHQIGTGWAGSEDPQPIFARMHKLLCEAISEFPFATQAPPGSRNVGKWELNIDSKHWLIGEPLSEENSRAG